MTKKKTRKIETGLHSYIYETAKVSNIMESIVKFFSVYGTEESGETGAMLRVFSKILGQANSHREVRRRMLSDVGANLSHLKEVYLDAKQALIEYKAAYTKLKAAKRSYCTRKGLMSTGKRVRKAKCIVARRESELYAKKRELKKVLDGFDRRLRKALLRTFFQFVKCEMFMAARMLETFSDSNSKLERWNTEIKELSTMVPNKNDTDQNDNGDD